MDIQTDQLFDYTCHKVDNRVYFYINMQISEIYFLKEIVVILKHDTFIYQDLNAYLVNH